MSSVAFLSMSRFHYWHPAMVLSSSDSRSLKSPMQDVHNQVQLGRYPHNCPNALIAHKKGRFSSLHQSGCLHPGLIIQYLETLYLLLPLLFSLDSNMDTWTFLWSQTLQSSNAVDVILGDWGNPH